MTLGLAGPLALAGGGTCSTCAINSRACAHPSKLIGEVSKVRWQVAVNSQQSRRESVVTILYRNGGSRGSTLQAACAPAPPPHPCRPWLQSRRCLQPRRPSRPKPAALGPM
eukprot:3790405-Prymnesium_polylepis.2